MSEHTWRHCAEDITEQATSHNLNELASFTRVYMRHSPSMCCNIWRRSKKTSKPRVPGLCVGNSPVTGEFPTQRASNAENVSIWWRHHDLDGEATSHFLLISWLTRRVLNKMTEILQMTFSSAFSTKNSTFIQISLEQPSYWERAFFEAMTWNRTSGPMMT